MDKASVIILSKTSTADEYKMTCNCIESLLASEDTQKVRFEIILIESNKQLDKSGFQYPSSVNVIIPDSPFNYHEYLNIGIVNSNSTMVALCNNDLVFKRNWYSEILRIKKLHPDIKSLSPIDYNNRFTPSSIYNKNKNDYLIGYRIREHIAGWCIVVDKDLFKAIGQLDEQFDFYYADDDYGMTLRKHNIKHALVLNSEVIHLGGASSDDTNNTVKKESSMEIDIDIPKYLYQPENKWIIENKKVLEGHLKFYKKWGSIKSISIKNKIFTILSIFNLNFLIKRLYN